MSAPPEEPGERPPEAIYRERRDAFAELERRQARKSLRFSVLRGALFLAFVVCLLFLLVHAGSAGVAWWGAAAFWLVAFLAVLPLHDRVIAAERRFADLKRVNEAALLRRARDWEALPVPRLPDPGELPPLARDLGLFGRASLFQLLGTAHTPPGKAALAGWLLAPAAPEEVAARQVAVAELAPAIELRQQLEVRTLPMEGGAAEAQDVEPFLRWAEDRPWLLARPWLTWLTRGLAVATLTLFAGTLAGRVPVATFLLLVGVNVALSHSCRQALAGLDRVSARASRFQLYAEAMALLGGPAFAAPRLARIAADLAPAGLPAHRAMATLHRRVELAYVRHSALLHLLLQVLLLWDFHVLWLLERWRRRAGGHARRWLAALGEFEALAALAALRFDNPDWAFPVITAGETRFAARALGHPLLPAGRRVANDVEVGPAGTFLLVTGSNMSGKSTLLRAIGANAVLAQAGGPVCAAALALPPLALATSILVEDSLADGVSFFLAELRRVRQVVDAAERCRGEGRTLLYLLDEVLRGTNSGERREAVRRVLLHLLLLGAIGAVSTHDLALAELPDLTAACRAVHFRETLHPGGGGPAMTFDYVLRPGVATTVNALKLLEMVGLAPEEAS
jgi:MutS-like protein